MEQQYWEQVKNEPGEYIASVILLHLNHTSSQIIDRLKRLGTKPQPSGRTSWEQIEPLLKEKWQDLTQEKRNETIRIFHQVSEAVREGLTDWFDSLKVEIGNLAEGGKYSGAYLGSYGHKIGPWDLLQNGCEKMDRGMNLIATVQRALHEEEEEENLYCTLDTAEDFIREGRKKVDQAMDIVSGRNLEEEAKDGNPEERNKMEGSI